MAVPLVASWRISQVYNCGGVDHKSRAYCTPVNTTPGSMTLLDRGGGPDIVLYDAMDAYANAISELVPGGATFSDSVIEHHVSGVWVPVDSHPVSPTTSGTLVKASQMTLVMRDTAFHKVKQVVLDTIIQPPVHSRSATGISTPVTDYNHWFVDTTDAPASPYFWMKSRANLFLAASPFISNTGDLNDKIRRAWGLQ